MATGTVELLIGTPIGNVTNLSNLFDNDRDTYAHSATADGRWAGIDGLAAVTVSSVLFMPRRSDGSQAELVIENRVEGAKIQASSAADFLSDVTDVQTIAAGPPFWQSYWWNTQALTSPPSKRYWRWLSANGTFGDLAGLRFLANAGPSNAKPCQPTISPYGGRFPNGSSTVTLTCATTSAALYYTTDGSTPDNTDTLYSAPFSLTIGGAGTTLKVVAYDASLSTTYSEVSSSLFNPWGYKPREDWRDDHGDLIEAHCGALLKGPGGTALQVDGYYWWFGSSGNRYGVNGSADGIGADGVWLYKSTDLYNWTRVGNILGLAGSHDYVLRPAVLYNAATETYVLWARVGSIPWDDTARAGIATASHPAGPWTWVDTDHQPIADIGVTDLTLFQDDDDAAYVIFGAGALMLICPLESDYQSATGESDSIDTATGREAPTLVKGRDGIYRLFCTFRQYYDSVTAQFGVGQFNATSMAGPWTGNPAFVFVPEPEAAEDYNGQTSCAVRWGRGILLLMDYWVPTNHYQSRYVWAPILEGEGQQLAVWDLSLLAPRRIPWLRAS